MFFTNDKVKGILKERFPGEELEKEIEKVDFGAIEGEK
jgi:hypothetical protein